MHGDRVILLLVLRLVLPKPTRSFHLDEHIEHVPEGVDTTGRVSFEELNNNNSLYVPGLLLRDRHTGLGRGVHH